MEQNKDQSGAAVRGEAVAITAADAVHILRLALVNAECAIKGREHTGFITQALVATEGPFATPISAHAADAPSEPSESAMRAALERIARWHGEFPDTGKVWPSGGAVSYAAEYGSNGERDYMRQVALDALKSRADDALDSQPTEPVADVQARVRDAVAENLRGLYYCGRVWSAWSYGTMGEDDFSPAEEDDDIIANITDAVMATIAPASRQPTDGGVRNG